MKQKWIYITLVLLFTSIAFAQAQDAAFAERLKRAEAMLNASRMDQQNTEQALKEFKQLLKQNGTCAECYMGLARIYFRTGAYKDALKTCEKLIQVSSDKAVQAKAHYIAGMSYMALGEEKAEKYKDSEQELRMALELSRDPDVHFDLGMAMLKQKRDQEGIAELQEFLKARLNTPRTKLAQQIIADPRRARENFAPEFSVTTAKGERMALADLKGRVVVLDFWGMW